MELIKLIRPQQWVKNLFVFIAPFFAGILFQKEIFIDTAIGFVAFSLAASSIYILNDIRDVEADRAHPTKKNRPIASGKISNTLAIVIMLVLGISAIAISTLTNSYFTGILATYIIINVAYCFGLKHVSILDMVLISFGFVLRTVGGGVIVDVVLTQWLVIIIFLLSLFLALAKRRDDILIFIESGNSIRKSSSKYNMEFINSAITMVSTTLIVAYLMYTISDEVVERMNFEYLYFTGLFVILGVLRYLQKTLVENDSSSPVRVLYTDRFIQLTLILWGLSYFLILYI
ncbi:decaprenyl-phosphate phosphoribosyltransferase [Fulvivirga sp.]|uniref:decaprenyl-phosphate phosphoribosyltransferase n=1 Tax=Fulvivirga sp. TaxID=1931237 RepID=UPI0032F084E9